jgi:DNA-binding NarL/FixJ family response regulator
METLMGTVEQSRPLQCIPEEPRIRAILVDRSPEYLSVVMALLEFHGLVDLVGRAASVEEAIELTNDLRPELILVDLNIQFAEFLIAYVAMSPELASLRVAGLASGNELNQRAAELVISLGALISKSTFREEFPSVLKSLFRGAAEKPAAM